MKNGHQKTYIKIWLSLIVLTGVTVGVSYFDFGVFNIFIAMLVATLKALLVALFFMHMIDDAPLNRVVFVSSFVFLILFVALTGADIFNRPNLSAVKVDASGQSGASLYDEMEKYRTETPALVATGSEIYKVQCALCHGANGDGKGPAGAALKPPPRNFVSENWTLGGSPLQIFETLTNGSPGTSMAGYSALSVKDRFALVHFIRSLSSKRPDENSKTLAAFQAKAKKGKGDEQVQETIPVRLAMRLLAVPEGSPAFTQQSWAISKSTFQFSHLNASQHKELQKHMKSLAR